MMITNMYFRVKLVVLLGHLRTQMLWSVEMMGARLLDGSIMKTGLYVTVLSQHP